MEIDRKSKSDLSLLKTTKNEKKKKDSRPKSLKKTDLASQSDKMLKKSNDLSLKNEKRLKDSQDFGGNNSVTSHSNGIYNIYWIFILCQYKRNMEIQLRKGN